MHFHRMIPINIDSMISGGGYRIPKGNQWNSCWVENLCLLWIDFFCAFIIELFTKDGCQVCKGATSSPRNNGLIEGMHY